MVEISLILLNTFVRYEIREELKATLDTEFCFGLFYGHSFFSKKLIKAFYVLTGKFCSAGIKFTIWVPLIDYKINSKILYFVD